MEIEMEKHKIECADLMKCGEITTQLSVGKKEFFLNCSFCDYTFLQLGDFIQHICEDHMCQFTNPKLEDEVDYSLELSEDMNEDDAQIPTEVSNEDSDDCKLNLREFEKVDIELEDKQMEDSMDFKDLKLMDEFVSEDSEDNINENETPKNGDDGDDVDSTEIAAYRQKLGLSELFNKNRIIAIFKGYENRPALWDNDTQLTRDSKRREMEIRNIAEEVGIPNEWESIRKIIGRVSCRLRTELLRKNIYLSKGKIYTPAWYNDLINFLQLTRSVQVKPEIKTPALHTTPTAHKTGIPESLLNDDQSIMLAEIYKAYTGLWDETDITYLFSNRRREALKAVHEKFNNKAGLNLTEYGIGCEIARLRKICTYEKRQKILCKQQNKNHKPSVKFYEHISYLEVDVLPFECSICEKVISGRSQYKIHVATHDGSLPFKCNTCGHGFKLSSNLAVHLRRHAQDYLYKCEFCDKSCVTTTEIKIHMRSHTGEKPYVCDICGKCFRTSSKISLHMRHHQNRPAHSCEVCNKTFFSKSCYREHMYVHQDVRDKICNICNKGFTSNKRLRIHKQIHADEKKYACKICDRRFAQHAGLSGHMKSHGIIQAAASSKGDEDVL